MHSAKGRRTNRTSCISQNSHRVWSLLALRQILLLKRFIYILYASTSPSVELRVIGIGIAERCNAPNALNSMSFSVHASPFVSCRLIKNRQFRKDEFLFFQLCWSLVLGSFHMLLRTKLNLNIENFNLERFSELVNLFLFFLIAISYSSNCKHFVSFSLPHKFILKSKLI